MPTRPFTTPIIILTALVALATLTYRAVPLALWVYHSNQANRLIGAGLAWPEPRYLDSMPQVGDAPMLNQAGEHLAAAMRYRPQQARAYRLAGQIALAQGQAAQAVEVLEQGQALAPHDTLLAWDTLMAYTQMAQMGQLPADDAAAMLKVRQSAGLTSEALISQAEYARQEGRYDTALVWCEWAELLEPYNGQVWYKMGLVYANLQDYEQSLSAYERAAVLLPNDRNAWYYLGIAYLRVQELQPAQVAYEQGLNATTGTIGLSDLYYQIGNLKLTAGKPLDLVAAWNAYEQALRLDDYIGKGISRSETYRQRGMLLVRQQRPDEALQQFEASLTLYPENYWSHHAMAQTLWSLDRQADALNWANKMIALRPELKYAYNLLGQFYTASGNIAEARAMYQKVLEIDPKDNTALQALDTIEQDQSSSMVP